MIKRPGDEVAQGRKDSKTFERLHDRKLADLIDTVESD